MALRAGALSRSGAAAAFAVGTITFGAGGLAFAAILLTFFISSTALSRVGRAQKKQLVDIGKSGARDGWQVLANGGVASLCALIGVALHLVAPDDQTAALIAIAAFAGAYAAAAADTWGTEIGTLVGGTPRSVITGKPLAIGLSGGVSAAGTLAEFGGAALVALVTWAFFPAGLPLLASVFLGGFGGAFVDSLLGETLQERRHCATCGRDCETNPHVCGTPTVLARGVAGMTNDAVNLAATAAGALISAGFYVAFTALSGYVAARFGSV